MLWLEQGLYIRIQELDNGPGHYPYKVDFRQAQHIACLAVLTPLKHQMPITYWQTIVMKYGLSVIVIYGLLRWMKRVKIFAIH